MNVEKKFDLAHKSIARALGLTGLQITQRRLRRADIEKAIELLKVGTRELEELLQNTKSIT